MRAQRVTVSTSHYDDETDVRTEDIEVHCAVSSGDRDYPSDVEILDALDLDGNDWTEAIESDRAWLRRIEDEAIEAASEWRGADTWAEARGER